MCKSKPTWVVCDQDCPPESNDDFEFEVSVCLEGSFGTQSFGWSGLDKIVILSGEDCDGDNAKIGYKKAMSLAKYIAEALNTKGKIK